MAGKMYCRRAQSLESDDGATNLKRRRNRSSWRWSVVSACSRTSRPCEVAHSPSQLLYRFPRRFFLILCHHSRCFLSFPCGFVRCLCRFFRSSCLRKPRRVTTSSRAIPKTAFARTITFRPNWYRGSAWRVAICTVHLSRTARVA